MKTPKILFFIILVSIAFSCSNSNKSTPTEKNLTIITEITPDELSLYERLGGEEGISSIVDDVISQHLSNPIISSKFVYLNENPKQLEKVKNYIKDFLGAGTGGPQQYAGANMQTVHSGMDINNTEFLAVVDDILLVLNNHNLSDQTKKDMLYILYSFKDQIVKN
jgi:hemoglobin